MSTDLAILQKALDREKTARCPNWQYYQVGASISDVHRLLNAELIAVAVKSDGDHPTTLYRLSDKGKGVVMAQGAEEPAVSFEAVMDAFGLIVGFQDIKVEMARAISARQKINFLLEGPPACAKSLFLEGVRSVVVKSYMAFGSATSASGLSDALFEKQPQILLLDEADKMRNDVYSILLGLMERGEVIDTKYKKTRGIKLQTSVMGACNNSANMTREFLSRFPWHIHFPEYSRSEFLDVCRGFLTRSEGCPEDVAEYIGAQIFDNRLGDVRKVRGVYQAMQEPTKEEVQRVIDLQRKYAPSTDLRIKRQLATKAMF